MKILFDLVATQPRKETKFHGGSEYGKTVYKRLLNEKKNEVIISFYDPNAELSKDIIEISNEYQIKLIPIKSGKELENEIQNGGYNKMYSALPFRYHDLDFSGIEFICTIHGLRLLEQITDKYEYIYCTSIKDYARYLIKNIFFHKYKALKKNQYKKLLQKIDTNSKIIVPSRHTKYSLISEFPYLQVEQIKILYSPLKHLPDIDTSQETERFLKKFDVEKESYFLITNADRFRKNAYRVLLAFNDIFTEFKGFDKKVLVLGCTKKNQLSKNLRNKDKFIFKDYIREDELNLLYSHAFAFIYPTINEGFGYPPLESMRYGTPVLASAISSVTEVCADAVIYFNPFSIGEIKTRILSIYYDAEMRKSCIEKGKFKYKEIVELQEIMLAKLCTIILGR